MKEIKSLRHLGICKTCGKKFIILNSQGYAYKINNDFYCSYKCFMVDKRKWIEKKDRNIKERR